jgi:hypothetical protein
MILIHPSIYGLKTIFQLNVSCYFVADPIGAFTVIREPSQTTSLASRRVSVQQIKKQDNLSCFFIVFGKSILDQ